MTSYIDYGGAQLRNATAQPGTALAGVAPGGSAGQVLTKNSASNYDTGWADPPAGGGGDGGGGGTTVTLVSPAAMAEPNDLPSAGATPGQQITVRNTSDLNSLMLRPQSGQTIDGLPQRYISPLGFLTVQSDGTNWVSVSNPHPPGAVVAAYSRVSVTAIQYQTPIDFDNAVYEPVPGIRVATPTARLIPPEPGWYRIHGHISSPSTTSGGLVKVTIQKNGADVRIYGMSAPPSGAFAAMAFDETLYCNGTDYVQFFLGTTGSVRSDHSVLMISYA